MKTTIPLGDLIAALYDEAEKETKDKIMQSALVRLALDNLNLLRYGMRKNSTMVKTQRTAA